MLSKIKEQIFVNLKNIPGWRTNKKIIVIECDDWGSIRMPSEEVYEFLLQKGLKIATSRFNKYDTLENEEDLDELFKVLHSVKDKNGHSAVITPATVMANPDFRKIFSHRFSEYFYEPFTETLKRYYPNQNVFGLWQKGIETGVFIPEVHGREHTNVQLWMNMLRSHNEQLLLAFDREFVSLDIPGVPEAASEFRAEYYFSSEDQKPFLEKSIEDSISLYKDIFGFKPRVFVPPNGIFHSDFDVFVSKAGIRYLNVSHSMPYPENGLLKYRHFITGQKGPLGLTYYTRNCAFEPTEQGYSGIDHTMKQIAAAFRWHKPANISTHRVNFVGGIDPVNRAKGLKELALLLKTIVHQWPDVEFMGSGDAHDYLINYTGLS
jgi:hypothetical protein